MTWIRSSLPARPIALALPACGHEEDGPVAALEPVAHPPGRAGLRERARVVTLSGREIWSVLDGSGRTGVAGGLTQGARILAAAKKAGADVLLTFDVRDYERLEPGGLRVESP